jgi:AcrR family transcriptional regulator
MTEPAPASPAPDARSRRVPRKQTASILVAAGLDVLAEHGWDGVTIAAVAREAGLSVGVVYLRFGDKDGLIFAMHDAFLARMRVASLAPKPRGDNLRERVQDVVERHCRLFGDQERLLRLFMTRVVLDTRLVGQASSATRVIAEHFESSLLEFRDDIARPDPERAATMCFRMVHDVAARRIARGSTFESDVELRWDRLIAELCEVCIAYLRSPSDVGR